MYAYRVAVKKEDGEIEVLPRIRTESLSMEEAIKKSKDMLSIYGGEIVSVAPESTKAPADVAIDISGLFFDIKYLAGACASAMGDSVGAPPEEKNLSVLQLLGIIQEKTEDASRLLQSIDRAEE